MDIGKGQASSDPEERTESLFVQWAGGGQREGARENPFGHERKEFNLVGQTEREK